MAKPLLSVRHISNEALLPDKLTPGRLYFVADEQVIIVDHGDGRGPVRYGDKPGPQGIAGEPVPALQGQIDELADASLATLLNLHNLNVREKGNNEAITQRVSELAESLRDSSSENAEAILNLLVIVSNKFKDYDHAIGILANTLTKFYPPSYGATAGDGSNTITTGEIITANGTAFRVDESYYDGETGVVTRTVYDKSSAGSLHVGDLVQIDNGYFVVNSIANTSYGGVIQLTLYADE